MTNDLAHVLSRLVGWPVVLSVVSSEIVFPGSHGSEYAQLTGVGQVVLLQGTDDFRLGAAQKWVGGFFHCDGGGQGDLVCRAQLLGGGDALFHGGVTWFAGQRETQVGGGVLVGAIDAGGIGQHDQTRKGMVQLCRRSFKVSAAACAEQHVSAEQDAGCDKCDVVVDMPGNLDDVELGAKSLQLEVVTLAQFIGDERIVRMSPPIYRHVVYFAQFCDAADVVAVAVSTQDRIQFKAALIQKGQHWRRFAWIDHDSVAVVVESPDVIVLKSGDGCNVEHGANGS
jgi:hypothetical protein